MANICRHCGEDALEVDEEGILEVCLGCGVVGSEGSFQNDSNRTVRTYESSDKGGDALWKKRKQLDGRSKHLFMSYKCLDVQAERLRLSKEYVMQVREKLRTVYSKKFYKGLPKCRNAIVGSCVFIVCRLNGMVVTLRNVAEAARCDLPIFARSLSKLKKSMDIHLDFLEPEELITNVLSQYGLLDTNYKNLVNDLYEFCAQTLMSSGRRASITVMALVYLCIECVSGHPVKRLKFHEVCALNTLKPEQVLRNVRVYREGLMEFAKSIPWLNVTHKKKVASFIKDILLYFKECEDYRKVNFKPEWLARKDTIEAEKREKISEAEKRIEACRKHCEVIDSISDDIILHNRCKVPVSSAQSMAAMVSSLSSDSMQSASATELHTSHICCPHCCIDKSSCPIYQQNGMSDFCKLDRQDVVIECLLRKGHLESELIEGNPESILYSGNYNSNTEAESRDLDDDDIPDEDLHLYIKTESEIKESTMLSQNLMTN